MLPKKQPPLVRAETICCVIAAVLAAFCLMDHPASRWLLAATIAMGVALFFVYDVLLGRLMARWPAKV